VEAESVANASRLDYLVSEVALEDPEIASTNPEITIEYNCTADELHFGMPGGSGEYEDEGDESNGCDGILTGSQGPQPTTELKRFYVETSNVDGYEGNDRDDAVADEEEDTLQADDGSTQNVEDWGNSNREFEDWTEYLRPAK